MLQKQAMATLSETWVSLRVMGPLLDPDEVSLLLNAQPTRSYRKDDVLRINAKARKIIAKFGMWSIALEPRTPGDLDGQIDELLGMVTDDPDVWRELHERFALDVFTGLFLKEPNEGISLKPSTLLALGSRGLMLDLDIYGGSDCDENDP